VLGAGYWGPNLVRNFAASPDCEVRWLCDLDEERAKRVVGRHSTIRTTASLETVLNDPSVDVVAIATPAATHARLGLACLDAGRHVLIEKPLAPSADEARSLVAAAERHGLVLMCDHTYCYTPTVRRIRDLVHSGQLGDIHYVDSVRINLGLVQSDIDVVWDLAPHDLSILDFILPQDSRPTAVAAHGADPIGAGHACLAYLTLPLSGNGIAHVHVNWLSPTKLRTTVIGGSKQMVVWDDLNPSQRLSMYDTGVDISDEFGSEARREAMVSYRIGDMVAPALPEYEALGAMARELVSAIREHRPPLTDGRAGLRVVEILEAASTSLLGDGRLVPI